MTKSFTVIIGHHKGRTLPPPPAFGCNIFYFRSGIAWTDEWFEIFFLKKIVSKGCCKY